MSLGKKGGGDATTVSVGRSRDAKLAELEELAEKLAAADPRLLAALVRHARNLVADAESEVGTETSRSVKNRP